jgi:hypothetical protein
MNVRLEALHDPLEEAIRFLVPRFKKIRVENPFLRLQSDKVSWEVRGANGMIIVPPAKGKDAPSSATLIEMGASGRFTDELFRDASFVFEVMTMMIRKCEPFKIDTELLLKFLDFRPRW